MNRISRPDADAGKGTPMSYLAGYVLSLILTISAFLLVARHVSSHHQIFSDGLLIALISILALIQLFVQLVAFLHLGRESKPRWNLVVMSFALIVVAILIFGSLWIMANLNYHHQPLTPDQTNSYILRDEGVSK